MRRAVVAAMFLIPFLFLGGTAWVLFAPQGEDPAATLMEYDFGGDFTLTGTDGEPASLSDHRGEVVLLFFGYTHCPDYCPTTLSKLHEVYDLLGEEGEEVVVLFVSVDPERDSPERLGAYLDAFDLPVAGLTGDPAAVDAVAGRYHAFHEAVEQPDSAAGYLVDHSLYLYLIDRRGRLRQLFRHDAPAGRIAATVRKLL